MSGPLLSIVTITYKDPEGLERTLKSLVDLLDLPSLSWEQIVVDSSPELNDPLFAGLPPAWPLVRLKCPANGIYSAQNLGIEGANGKYLWLLNGGDRLKDITILGQYLDEIAAHPDIDIFFGSAELVRNGSELYIVNPKPNFLTNLIGENRLCHQAMIYKKSVFDQLGLFSTSYKIASDYEHHWKCHVAGLKSRRIPLPICVYDMGGASNQSRNAFVEFRRVHKEIAAGLPRWQNTANSAVWAARFARLKLIKTVANSSIGPALRPLWLRWNRFKTGH